MTERRVIECRDLDQEIDRFIAQGYRLDMMMPADAPREALLSEPPSVEGGLNSILLTVANRELQAPATAGGSDWTVGRVGMIYRDVIPDRLSGKVIASHIRIVEGGEVSDRVHYHKIDFQLIFCLKGAIRVVYEDQGEPFWLRPGDCVLQPPEIRHRVLEAEAGSEVIEVTSPAEHETWFDHYMQLPTETVRTDRLFGNQLFTVHSDVDSKWAAYGRNGILISKTRIPRVSVLSADKQRGTANILENENGRLRILIDGRGVEIDLTALLNL